MEVRKATLRDAEAVLNLQIETIRASCSADYTPAEIDAWIASRRLDHMEWLISLGQVWVAVDSSGTVLGFGTLKGNSILKLFVAPQCQRTGIGSALLTHLERAAAAESIEITTESTITAVEFYRRNGYEEITRKKWGDAQMEVVAMTKQLRD